MTHPTPTNEEGRKITKWQDWYLRIDGMKVHESVWEYLIHTVHPFMTRDIRAGNESAVNVYFAYCLGVNL